MTQSNKSRLMKDREERNVSGHMPVDHQQSELQEPSTPRAFRKSMGMAVGGLTAIGVAWAAAYTVKLTDDRSVAMTAWIAAAVVGTASTVSAARNS